jgi:hypothetical protein
MKSIIQCSAFALIRTVALLSLFALPACVTRTLRMPQPDTVPSPTGETIEVGPVSDERAASVLGKVDTITIESTPDLVSYVEAELVNALSRLGFAVRQVERNADVDGRKRVLASLLSAELSSESTLLHPVAAAVRLRIELLDESGQLAFRKEIRGATSRDLGAHTQGGPEDARLLADVIDQALSRLAADESFLATLTGSAAERAERRPSPEEFVAPPTRAEPPKPTPERGRSAERVAERLGALDALLEQGLIDQEDYDDKRREILDEL